MTSPIRIYLVSDNELAGEAMGTALAADDRLSLAGTASHFPTAYPFCAAPDRVVGDRVVGDQVACDVVLVDATDAGDRALELVRSLADADPCLKPLPPGLASARQVVDFLEAGASGYAMKHDSLAAVVRTIAAVAAGRPPCSPRITALVFARIVELKRQQGFTAPRTAAALSARERQVLRLLASGLRNKEIAQRLGIALSTAGNHVQRILDKLEVHRRRDAIRRAYQHGLLDGALPLAPA